MPKHTDSAYYRKEEIMPQHAEIVTTSNPNIFELIAPYNSRFVTDLKFMVQPAVDRQWDKDKQRWIIAKKHIDLVRQIASSYYETVNERLA